MARALRTKYICFVLILLFSTPLISSSASDTGTKYLPLIFAQRPPASSSSYPLKLGPTNRYLVDQQNVPVFWSGDAAWSLIAQLSQADAVTYLSDRQQKGVNVVLVNLLEHKFADKAPRNSAGDAPFTGTTFTTPNEAYFAHADAVIAAAAQRGIVVLLDPLYLGYGCGDEGWCAEVQAASTANLQSWGQYVGARYRNVDNIVWVIGGDMDPRAYSGVQSKMAAFATALQQADGRHLFTAHNAPTQMAIDPWPSASWLTVNAIYVPDEATYQYGDTAYSTTPVKPFFDIEGNYENEHSMTTQGLRAQAYWAVLSGGFGYIFGNCPIWSFDADAGFGFCGVAGWKNQLNSSGSRSMQYVAQLFRARAWQNLVPDDSHALVTAGYGSYGGTDYATAARTPDGRLALAYLPTRRTVTVAMSQLTGSVTARWYDPSNGSYTAIAGSPFANSGTRTFTPPSANSGGDNDWVLVLEAA